MVPVHPFLLCLLCGLLGLALGIILGSTAEKFR